MENNDALQDYLKAHQKRGTTAFLLAVLLGPLGLCYASVVWGLVLLALAIVSAGTLVGPGIVWVLSIVLAVPLVNEQNKKIETKARLIGGG